MSKVSVCSYRLDCDKENRGGNFLSSPVTPSHSQERNCPHVRVVGSDAGNLPPLQSRKREKPGSDPEAKPKIVVRTLKLMLREYTSGYQPGDLLRLLTSAPGSKTGSARTSLKASPASRQTSASLFDRRRENSLTEKPTPDPKLNVRAHGCPFQPKKQRVGTAPSKSRTLLFAESLKNLLYPPTSQHRRARTISSRLLLQSARKPSGDRPAKVRWYDQRPRGMFNKYYRHNFVQNLQRIQGSPDVILSGRLVSISLLLGDGCGLGIHRASGSIERAKLNAE